MKKLFSRLELLEAKEQERR